MSLPTRKPTASPTTVVVGSGIASGSLAFVGASGWVILIQTVGMLLLARLVAVVQGAVPQESADRVSFWKDFWKYWTTRRRDVHADRRRKAHVTVIVPGIRS